jgi:hypothetical protein
MSRARRRQSAVDGLASGDGTRAFVGGAEKGGGPVQSHFKVISEVVAP